MSPLPMIDGYIPPPPSPPPPPPPPPELAKKPPEEAKKIVDDMTAKQVTDYKTEVDKLPKADQQQAANDLTKNLGAEQLAKLRPAFGESDNGKNIVDQAVQNYGSAEQQQAYPAAVVANDPKISGTLQDLGFSQQEIDSASIQTINGLTSAAEHAGKGEYAQAIGDLKQLADSGQQALAEKALPKIAESAANLPPLAKDILTDPAAAKEILKASAETVDKLLQGDVPGAIAAIGDNKPLRDAVIDAALKDPNSDFSKGVAALGLDADKLKEAGDAAPALFSAVDHAAKQEWTQAGLALANAASQAPELVADGIKHLAGNLPEPARSILSDDGVASQLSKASPETLRALVQGKPVEALQGMADNKELRDAVIDAALKDPESAFSKNVDKLGLNADDLKQAGDGLPDIMKAVGLASTAQDANDWRDVGLALADASAKAPDVVAKGIEALANRLPEPAKSIVGDPAVAKELAKASPEALKSLLNGKPDEALQHVADNKPLRDAVIDAALKDPASDFSKNVAKLGLTAADLKQAGDGLPDVMKAVTLASTAQKPEDWKNVGLALADAAGKAPDVVAKGIQALAGKLPEGLARTVLTDPAVAGELAQATPEAIKAMLNGDPVAALSAVGGNPQLRNAVIDAAVTDPSVKPLLDKYDITATDLKQSGDAAAHLFNAVREAAGGNLPAALDALRQVGEAAPELLSKVAGAIYENLDDPTKAKLQELGYAADNIGEIAKALPSLVDAAKAMQTGDWKTAISKILDAGEAAPTVGKDALQKLGEQIPDGKFDLVKKLLADDAVATGIASDTALHDAIDQLLDGKTLEGASALLHNDGIRDAVLDVVGKDEAVVSALGKAGLTAADLKQAGAAAPHLLDAGIALAKQPDADWQGALDALGAAAGAAPDLLTKVVGKVYDALPPGIQTKFTELKISKQNLLEAGAALPHFVNAMQKLGGPNGPDWQGALQELGQGLDAAPGLVTKTILALGEKIPDSPQTQLLKTLLTDEALVSTLVGDEDLHGSVQQLLNGDIEGGLKGIADNTTVMTALGNALAKDPAFMTRLAPLGITTGADIAQLGPALAGIFDLADAIKAGNVGDVIKSLGNIGADLPDGMRDKLIDTIATKFDLKPEFKDMIRGALEAISEPEVAAALGDAFEAFKSGNPVDFIQALAHVGAVVSEQAPGLAISFLNALSHLPGSVGKFFSDPALNAAIVESGSLGHFFTAIEKLASGDIGGAIGELGTAIAALIQVGDNIELGPYKVGIGPISKTFGPYDMHVSEEGIGIVGKLMTQFVEAMPPTVKTFLEEKAAKAAASTGLKSIPVIGPVIGLAEAGKNLYDDIKNGESGLTVALDVADLVINGAGLIPGASAATAPLRTLLGVAQAVNDTVGFVQDMGDFGEQFTGMAA